MTDNNPNIKVIRSKGTVNQWFADERNTWRAFGGDEQTQSAMKGHAMRKELVGAVTAIALCSGCATIETATPKWQLASIDSKSNEGVSVGHFNKGDTIILQYVEGKWTVNAPDIQTIPMLSPDETLDPNSSQRLKDHQMLYMVELRENYPNGFALKTLPYDTKQRPYVHTLNQACDVYLRIHDYYLKDNDGSVIYRVRKQ